MTWFFFHSHRIIDQPDMAFGYPERDQQSTYGVHLHHIYESLILLSHLIFYVHCDKPLHIIASQLSTLKSPIEQPITEFVRQFFSVFLVFPLRVQYSIIIIPMYYDIPLILSRSRRSNFRVQLPSRVRSTNILKAYFLKPNRYESNEEAI